MLLYKSKVISWPTSRVVETKFRIWIRSINNSALITEEIKQIVIEKNYFDNAIAIELCVIQDISVVGNDVNTRQS